MPAVGVYLRRNKNVYSSSAIILLAGVFEDSSGRTSGIALIIRLNRSSPRIWNDGEGKMFALSVQKISAGIDAMLIK